ncbi:MAG: hypothetical protein H5T99_04875 [Moorella sp. (in: Bacteria)]|nr:hypothetical protein [Moorella sp. (in: firmicutes)]
MKVLALGPEVVYIGTAAVMALISQQMTKVAPDEPPAFANPVAGWPGAGNFE